MIRTPRSAPDLIPGQTYADACGSGENEIEWRRVKRTEDVLHVQVWRMLRSLLPADAVAWSSESRGVGGEEGGRRKARGVIAGTPDLQVMYCGRTLFIELKAPRGSVSGEQRHLHDRLRRAGFSVAVCRSIEDVVGALERFGIPLRGRIAA